jgi:hypothetical protein
MAEELVSRFGFVLRARSSESTAQSPEPRERQSKDNPRDLPRAGLRLSDRLTGAGAAGPRSRTRLTNY